MAEEANLMDDLASAWDDSGAGDGMVETPEETPDVIEPDQSEPDVPAEGGADADAGGTGDPAEDDPGLPAGGEPSELAEAGAVDEKPPVGLSPAAREAWKDTPEAVRKDISKREADYERGIEKHRADSARAQQMDQVLAPFQQYLAMNGGAGPTINTLLQTGTHLQTGSPIQKAEMIAQLISQFGVDVSTLDNVLVGKAPPPEQQQQTEVQSAIDQAVAPYQQFMGQFQQQPPPQQETFNAGITSDIDTFSADPKNEFYKDVRMDMADLLDMAAKRGEEMSMDQAYDRACHMRPDIRQIINGRISQDDVNTRRNAASSVTGGPGGPGAGNGAGSMRDTIESAFDNAGRV